jgi:hypothetical protein
MSFPGGRLAVALRPLSLSELLDRTFSLYRQNFVLFAGIAALPNLLLFAMNLTNLLLTHGNPPSLATFVMLLPTAAVTLGVLTLAQAATVFAVSHLYLDRPITIGSAYSQITPHLLGLCGLIIVVGLLTFVGFICLIVPGIWLMLRWSLAVPVAVLEKTGLGAMTRSADLTRGDRGRIFMIYLLYIIVAAVFSALWNVPLAMAIALGHGNAIAPPLWTQVLVQVGAFFTQCVVAPLMTVALSLVYYDERVRKEGFDLEHMMATLDSPATAGA